MERIKHTTDRRLLFVLIGLLLGAALVLGVRYYNLSRQHTHYHATFAVFIEGQREDFNEPGFYEEIAACAPDGSDPAGRVHMHQPDNDVVHVHDDLVTWGNFFENIGFSISERHIKTPSQLYVDRGGSPLVFWLNSEPVRNPANMVIGDGDSLLISYGTTDEAVLRQQLDAIEHGKAEVANRQDDPGSCGGGVHDWQQLLRQLF